MVQQPRDKSIGYVFFRARLYTCVAIVGFLILVRIRIQKSNMAAARRTNNLAI